MSPSVLAGTHYPRSIGEFQAWFSTDADCLDYLDYLECAALAGGLRVSRVRPCPGAGAGGRAA